MSNFLKSIPLTIVVASALLCCGLSAKSQKKDYVIITRGDTIYCKLKFPAMSDYGYYKTDDVSEDEKLNPYQINEYYVAKKNTLYKTVFEPGTKQLQFMQVIEKGKISLYEFIGKGWGTGAVQGTGGYYHYSKYYISKGSGELEAFSPNKSGKAIFAELIIDNKNVYDKYTAKDDFDIEKIRNLIQLYNAN